MAFFGLTALGEQNTLQASLRESLLLEIFTDEVSSVLPFLTLLFPFFQDYLSSFNNVSADGFTVTSDQLPSLLEDVYHGEVPEADQAIFLSLFEGKEEVNKSDFESKLAEMRRLCKEKREELEAYCSNAIESVQLSEFNLMKKYHHTREGPREKYASPLSSGQEIGWTHPPRDIRTEHHGKVQCEETKFVAHLIQNGIYF